MTDLGHAALGAWSGGRFLHYGVTLDDDRLVPLLRPDDRIRTVVTADVYGEGEADRLVGRAIAGLDRAAFRLVGAVGHDFVDGERDGPRGYPRFTDPRLRGAGSLRLVPAARGRGEPRALRCRALRSAAPAQPGPHRLHVARGLGRDGRAARRGSRRLDRRRPGPRERLHARRHRLPRALRAADRLGDADPEPVRALARPACPARLRRARRACARPGRRLRRAVPRRAVRRVGARPSGPSPVPSRRAGSPPGASGSTSCARSPIATASRCCSSRASGRSPSPPSPASCRR